MSELKQERHLGKPSLRFRDTKHTPWNKRQGEVESFLVGHFTRYHPDSGVDITLEEVTTSHGGRTSSRTISTQLTREQMEWLAAFLLERFENLP